MESEALDKTIHRLLQHVMWDAQYESAYETIWSGGKSRGKCIKAKIWHPCYVFHNLRRDA